MDTLYPTVYRARITKLPGDHDIPDHWQVELLTHTEDGVQIEFFGKFWEEQDAQTIAAAWRDEKTRPIVWLCASLTRPDWHDDQEVDDE